MDEKLVEEISSSTGVPQELVSRSAQARAEANGVDINNILSNWSSGEVVAPSPQVDKQEPVVAETVVATMEEVAPPVTLFTKIIKTLQYGSLFGVVAGFIQAFIISSNLYDGLVLESETLKLIANYEQSRYILNLALTTTFFAIVNSVNIKKILDTNFEGFGIHTSDRESVFLGLGLGLIFGSSTGFLFTSSIGQVI